MTMPANNGLLRGLITDFGGVLTTPVTRSFREFCRRTGMPRDVVKEVFVEAYGRGDGTGPVHQLELGRISAEEFSLQLAELLGERTGVAVESANLLRELFAGVRLEERMLSGVERIRAAGVPTALLSNSWGHDGGYPRERFAVLFDAVVISGEEGLRKPDPRIYELAAERLELAPDACVFVDDLEANITAAEHVGMTGVAHRSVEQTLPRLAELFGLDAAVVQQPVE